MFSTTDEVMLDVPVAERPLEGAELWEEVVIPIRIKNDNCVASPCRAAALSAASRLVLLSNANWN